MPKFDIWSEGFSITGIDGKAQMFAEGVEAETFEKACDLWFNTLGNVTPDYYKPAHEGSDVYGKVIHYRPSFWGCSLYDNEEDARRSFG